MRASEGEQGSSSKVGANDIVRALGDDKDLLGTLAEQSYAPDLTLPYYRSALGELRSRMLGGHKLAARGANPSDADPSTHAIIWGHTQITGPDALLHFTVCHYFERFFSQALIALGGKVALLAAEKDFFINALDDVVILGDDKGTGDHAIFAMWSKSKPFGLGWVTLARIDSYASS